MLTQTRHAMMFSTEADTNTPKRVRMHACMHGYIHTCMHACMQACVAVHVCKTATTTDANVKLNQWSRKLKCLFLFVFVAHIQWDLYRIRELCILPTLCIRMVSSIHTTYIRHNMENVEITCWRFGLKELFNTSVFTYQFLRCMHATTHLVRSKLFFVYTKYTSIS